MSGFFRLVVFVLALIVAPVISYAGTPTSAGAFTNPAANTIFADSGSLNEGNHEVTIMVSGTVNTIAVLEYRNAANDANVWSQFVIIPANGFQTYRIDKFTISNTGERVRLRLNAAITGSAQGSIIID